jgi:Pvc16 N-terminal domain
MSSAYAIAAVTAIIKRLLSEVLAETDLASALNNPTVTVQAPDQIKLDVAPTSAPQLNLFLYHVQPNAAWRNRDLPSFDGRGNRVATPSVALDLHYLVTAYAPSDFQAETLLGHAALFFHDVPLLSQEQIRDAFTVFAGGSSLEKLLAKSRLADQLEQIRITPHAMNVEEMSKVWSALQSRYRPSIAYEATVVLMESDRPARAPLPVLRRDITVRPSLTLPFPALTAAVTPKSQSAVRTGETLKLQGHGLAADMVNVRFEAARGDGVHLLAPATATDSEVEVVIANLPAGGYAVSVEATKNGVTRTTNELPVAVAPAFGLAGAPQIIDSSTNAVADGIVVTIATVTPPIEPEQQVSLIVGERQASMKSIAAPTSTPEFFFTTATRPPDGRHFARIRVDGVDSLLVLREPQPAFDETQQIDIP